MKTSLQRSYLLWIIPAVLLATGAQTAIYLGLAPVVPPLPPWIHGLVFVLSAVTAIAGPVMVRTGFAHAHRTRTAVSHHAFFRFQKQLLRMALVTPYFAALALICRFPRFYAAGIVLLALYAVYYYYPSVRRIEFDKKVFRVTHDAE